MPYLQLASAKYPLLEGETRVGRGDSADVRLPSAGEARGIDLVITVRTNLSASVRRESNTSSIAINGITLGSQPSPLFHGDRLDVDGVGLVFGDESQAGMTTRVAAIGSDETPRDAPRQTRRGRTGGRMVSLIDGREYTVRPGGLTVGRDAGCDVVISAADVSRRHARIDLKPEGYRLVDLSTNGVLVNGTRIQGAHPLAKGDVIRVGPEEFRFHAETEGAEPEADTGSPIILATPPSVAAPAPPEVRNGHGMEMSPAWPGGAPAAASDLDAAASPAPAERPTLATLEAVMEGPLKGTRFDITVALTHVGRGAYNEVVLAEESVSDSHAKIQRRGSGWFVVDLDSTNGTYVAGKRVKGEALLLPGEVVQFGGVELLFVTVSAPHSEPSGTRVIPRIPGATPKSARTASRDPEDSASSSPPLAGESVPKVLLGALLLLAFVVIFLLLRTL
jgi:pSer/pThr/pTyr-binding forkhead associated (FHA) protein